jgi:hypothetical protein
MINPTNEQVLDTINTKADTYEDIVTNSNELFYYCNDNTFDAKGYIYEGADSALSQFLNRLGIPILFFKRCPVTLQQEIIDQFNRDKEFLLRGINRGTGLFCRAVLSPSFSRERDDKHIFPVILDGLSEIRGIENKLFTWDDNISELRVSYPNTLVKHDNNDIEACVSIINSETGHSSIWIEPSIVVGGYEFKNVQGENPGITRIRHYGDTPKAAVIKQAVQELNNIAQVGILQYLRASTETVTSKEAIDFIESINNYPNRFKNILTEELEKQERVSKTEVLKQVLSAAKDLPILQTLTIKRQVGRFIRLFENTQNDFLELKNI